MTGFVALILMRVLRSDFSRYSRDEEDLDGRMWHSSDRAPLRSQVS
jgi:hypothetical protein